MNNPSPGFRMHPEHTITIEPYRSKVTVRTDGAVVASSEHALELKEVNHPPVLYVPFADIDFSVLEPTATSTHCPYKGDASYWRRKGDGGEDVMWAYQQPYDEMSAIRDYGAFYANRVQVEAS